MREARYRLVYVSAALVMSRVFELYRETNGRMILHKVEGLPEDYEVMDVCYNFDRNAFAFKVWHKDFDVVETGSLIPDLEIMVSEYLDPVTTRGRQWI